MTGWILCPQAHPSIETAATGQSVADDIDYAQRIDPKRIGIPGVLLFWTEEDARAAARQLAAKLHPVPFRVRVEVTP